MRLQPDRSYNSNDEIMTPRPLAFEIVQHFNPLGSVLEPCSGDDSLGEGSFMEAFAQTEGITSIDWCELNKGRDFMDYAGPRVDWIITNPPWSKIAAFMEQAFKTADNVVLLLTINHIMTTCRWRLANAADMGLKEIYLIDWPENFPKSGFLLGCVHWRKGYSGDTHFTDARKKP